MYTHTISKLLATSTLLWIGLAQPVVAQGVPTFTDNSDGTVTDNRTGLMWDKCPQGLSGANCDTGGITPMNWVAALQAAADAASGGYKGHTDWRLPNKKELESLVDITNFDPALDTTAFPGPGNASLSGNEPFYWSSTTNSPNPLQAWLVVFRNGIVGTLNKTGGISVRLVRGGQ